MHTLSRCHSKLRDNAAKKQKNTAKGEIEEDGERLGFEKERRGLCNQSTNPFYTPLTRLYSLHAVLASESPLLSSVLSFSVLIDDISFLSVHQTDRLTGRQSEREGLVQGDSRKSDRKNAPASSSNIQMRNQGKQQKSDTFKKKRIRSGCMDRI
mmetsp:Transcript_41907/g.82756  ORF Transcript_41907/g.82756 Transcript_41907/m.82756 type:complete len:154 (+) Transcript_41907:3288-3749(+)